jgi:hypothetical protein
LGLGDIGLGNIENARPGRKSRIAERKNQPNQAIAALGGTDTTLTRGDK